MILAALRAEWFKLVRRPAVWVTVGLLLVLAVGIGYLVTYLVATHPPNLSARGESANFAAIRGGLHPASLVKKALSNANTLDGIFALILGVLAQGSEFSWGTIKTTQTQLPGRLAIVAGQLISIALLLLIMVLGIFGADALASYLIALADGAATTFPSLQDVLRGIGAEWLIFGFVAGFGYALATVFKQSAMAIGLGLGYLLVVESLVFSLLDNLGDTFKNVHELFPVANAGYLQQSFGRVPGVVGFVIGGRTAPDATHAVIALTVWTAALLIAAASLIRARDVL
ncbi:MAG: ABC transporter permease [Candidatus Dormibacterales bacterium]